MKKGQVSKDGECADKGVIEKIGHELPAEGGGQ